MVRDTGYGTITVNSFRDSISELMRSNHLCSRRGQAKSRMSVILH